MVGPIVFVALPAEPVSNSIRYEVADQKESRGDQKERDVVKHGVDQMACGSNEMNESQAQLEESSNISFEPLL